MRLARNGMGGAAGRDPEMARAVLRRAIELGVDHIDTAHFYRSPDGRISANDLIREALAPYPEHLVIATKVGPVITPTGATQGGPEGIRPSVEANLVRLGVDRLDVVYLRIGWREPPSGESLSARFEVLAELQREGLIRHLGLSNVDQTHVAEAQRIAPVVAIQNLYDPRRANEVALVRSAADQDIAFVPFGQLGSGRGTDRDEAYAAVAGRHDATVAQVALAHLLALAPNTLAIPGTGSIAHLEENVAARSLALTAGDLAELNRPIPA
jgi:aryl-alcohol dehydrogenase-like predicted oxidoreductase